MSIIRITLLQFFVLLLHNFESFSQKLDVYDWPVKPGEALLSDNYKVTLEVDGTSQPPKHLDRFL
jgi:hypothetical protein